MTCALLHQSLVKMHSDAIIKSFPPYNTRPVPLIRPLIPPLAFLCCLFFDDFPKRPKNDFGYARTNCIWLQLWKVLCFPLYNTRPVPWSDRWSHPWRFLRALSTRCRCAHTVDCTQGMRRMLRRMMRMMRVMRMRRKKRRGQRSLHPGDQEDVGDDEDEYGCTYMGAHILGALQKLFNGFLPWRGGQPTIPQSFFLAKRFSVKGWRRGP